jgi:cytochrome c551
MTKRLCGRFITLSIIIVLAACSSTKENTSSSTVPANAVSPAASEAPKATNNPTASPIATQTVTPTAAPQVSASPATLTPTLKPTPKPTEPATATPMATASNSDTSAAAASLYKQNCISCHGVDLKGGFGPDLQKVGARLTKAQITKQIHDGGGDMPPFGKRLKDEEIQSLTDWLSAKKN